MALNPYDEELLSTLTAEERAGLEDESLVDPGELEADAAHDAPAPEIAASELPDTLTIEGTVKDITTQQQEQVKQPEPVAQAPEALQLPDYKLPEDFEAKLASVHTAQDELAAKFDDGELSAAEYNKQHRELSNQMSELERVRIKAEISHDSRVQSQETAVQTWYTKTVPDWLADHSNYEQGTVAWNAFELEVRRLQVEAGDSGALNKTILDNAHENVQREFRKQLGIADPTPTPTPPKTPAKQLEQRQLVPSLASVPASDGAEFDDSSKFAVISRLDGLDKEKAMASLSDAETAQYLNSPYA